VGVVQWCKVSRNQACEHEAGMGLMPGSLPVPLHILFVLPAVTTLSICPAALYPLCNDCTVGVLHSSLESKWLVLNSKRL